MEKQKFFILGPWTQKLSQKFHHEKIYIKDAELLASKLNKFVELGKDEIQIVTDFDQTVTAFECNGRPSQATFSFFRQSPFAPRTFCENMTNLYQHYAPIERDQSIKFEAKDQLMKEWYGKVSEEFRKANFSQELALKCMNSANVAFRYLYEDFLRHSFENNIPKYIVSGGIDVVQNFQKLKMCQGLLNEVVPINQYGNLHLLSNRLILEDNVVKELQMEVFSTSKSEVLKQLPVAWKKNTLLLGDLPSDFYMSQCIDHETQISIGFAHNENQLADYTKLFDIVIVGEPTYLIPLLILNKVLKRDIEPLHLEHLKEVQYADIAPLLA